MTLSVQFYTLAAMIGMGLVLGMAVDTYYLLLRIRFHKGWTKYICDFLFWILYTVILFNVLYQINEGTLRIHVFLAILCGFAMYKALFASLYIHFMLFVYRIVSKTIYFSINVFKAVVIRPVYWLIMGIRYLIAAFFRGMKGLLRFMMRFLFRIFGRILQIFWWMLPKMVQKKLELFYDRVYESVQKAYHQGLFLYNKLKSWWNHYK